VSGIELGVSGGAGGAPGVCGGADGGRGIQYVAGCTAGKGNLIFRDYGKHVYTFYHRKTGRGIRIYADYFIRDSEDDARFVELRGKIGRGEATEADREELRDLTEARCQRILDAPKAHFIRIGPAQEPMPRRATSPSRFTFHVFLRALGLCGVAFLRVER